MGEVTYHDGIAILQLVIFPLLLVIALRIWNRIGWRAGGKSWRFVVTLSLLRIAGSISTLLTINSSNERIFIAEAVCELIGIAPLILTYVGLLGQIDTEQNLNPRHLRLATLAGFIGLIIGIVGVCIIDTNKPFKPNSEMKVAMAIFIALFVVMILLTLVLALQLGNAMHKWQKKLFLAIVLGWPFLLVRLVYSAMADFRDDQRFSIVNGSDTIYLCMDVLEEIVAMAICVVFGWSAVKEKERKEIATGEVMVNLMNDHV
ncbi:Hypothetical protein PENO1_057970 [Penicillium occitanis (nom. inval.)]|nr:Hypothetical protein PENO1_057970 [Penicillium occitanis (nom. inval.)]PCG99314.1 hypothetical protein PENOC_058690 [Penicillium occitanis (nom. inval.)]